MVDGPTTGAGVEVILQVRDTDVTSQDATKNVRGCYKRGDVVQVLAGSAHDGNLAVNPIAAPWYFIRLTGLTPAQAALFQQEETTGTPETGIVRVRRRRYRVNLATVPQAVLDALAGTRYVVWPWAQARAYLVNKGTGAGS